MRVAITGLGIVSAAGVGVDAFWRRIAAGEVRTRPARGLDASTYTSDRAGQVDDPLPYVDTDPPGDGLSKRDPELATAPRSTRLAVSAAALAVRDAGLTPRD